MKELGDLESLPLLPIEMNMKKFESLIEANKNLIEENKKLEKRE